MDPITGAAIAGGTIIGLRTMFGGVEKAAERMTRTSPTSSLSNPSRNPLVTALNARR
jgi:hypothetical protein